MMTDITINVVNYDENSHCLIVNFSDGEFTTPNLSFQPFHYGDKTYEEIMIEISKAGMRSLETERLRENYKKQKTKVDKFKKLINTSVTYTIPDVVNRVENDLEIDI